LYYGPERNCQLKITYHSLLSNTINNYSFIYFKELPASEPHDINSPLSSLTLTNSHEDQVIINDFLSEKYQNYLPIGELIVGTSLKLEELHEKIKELINCREDNELNVRVRFMQRLDKAYKNTNHFQLKKCLIDLNKSIKTLGFRQEADICVEIIEDTTDISLNQGIILIDCIRIDLKTRMCSKSSFKTVAWNINNGATLNSLKESIVRAYQPELLQGDVFRMSIAKRLNDKYQWLLLKELNKSGDSEVVKTKKSSNKKKSGQCSNVTQQQKSNLRTGPFNMDDGDLVAFTLECSVAAAGGQVKAEDFLSGVDLEYASKSRAEVERLRKERSDRKQNQNGAEYGGSKSRSYRRAEVGITIKIDDFNS